VYRVADQPIACFFRDDGLSDLIGFEYSVARRGHDLRTSFIIWKILPAPVRIAALAITVILDGENAWEYPENAYHFLERAVSGASHARLKLAPANFRAKAQPQPVLLPALVAGSWVHGTLST
jgi:alpha-amylase/alpha-mannosidase (GH57 family)